MCKKLIYLFSFALLLDMVPTRVADAGLVGWWRFNEDSGDIANDSSGNDYTSFSPFPFPEKPRLTWSRLRFLQSIAW